MLWTSFIVKNTDAKNSNAVT